ncbi:rab geranylgeranyltransferase escort protein [Schizosaccharomyces octosporus yFS286]|uniref:Rab proteins geranylgeranyltransferase n=1 Tax=Schizosaccharomyces octosporus (strain yFS286) TaxID=483514 RepID=S9Q1I9_SCHOY|nr:rab geranylgeranyltransferase escort protein [Schizosaccharomyces octosporus yFS286]EPX75136.1 rab geranylgeranyltransferase escort protein [Schizosaccharomyces octosporus yFS286]
MQESKSFDVILLGTNLVNSILSSACAWADLKVLHIDENPFYGEVDASFGLKDVISVSENGDWKVEDLCIKRTGSNAPSLQVMKARILEKDMLPSLKGFMIEFIPKEMYAGGSLVELLSKSKIYKYLLLKPQRSFRLYASNKEWTKVPESRADIFNDKTLSLTQKRLIMRFMKYISSIDDEPNQELLKQWLSRPFKDFLNENFELPETIREGIIYGLCQALDPEISTECALEKIKKYFQSFGNYGDYSYLIAMYGTGSELCQGFCRSSAVMGGTFMLAQKINKIEATSVELSDGEKLSAKNIISSQATNNTSMLEKRIHQRCLLVRGKCPGLFHQNLFILSEASQLHFVPYSLGDQWPNSVQARILGVGAGSCPEGYTLWYLQTLDSLESDGLLAAATDKLIELSHSEDTKPLMYVDMLLDQRDLADYDVAVETAKQLYEKITGSADTFFKRDSVFDDDDE